ncbi:hypothetical protein JFN94_06675 [Burkholderia anthina]|uniref:Exported phage protein n=1 Tax=Burkholderia anthina TaxID=179879 RepID=A0A7T7AIF9_9BURK|nr:hypothetical protein [Burkholderia anthina]QQK03841.1 hypothetical protein JFN94_06675 [Burkholderia anthina]
MKRVIAGFAALLVSLVAYAQTYQVQNLQVNGSATIQAPLGLSSGGTGSASPIGATSNLQYQGTGTGATARSVTSKLGDVVSVFDYPVACNGSTNDSPAIQNVINQNPGKIIKFPYTGSPCIINTALTQSNPPVSFQVDSGVTFGGTVAALPAAFTNPQQVNVGNYYVQTPAYANTNGASPLQVESLPTSTFTGNAVALYAATRSPLGNPAFSGILWAANFLTTLSASTGTYNGQGVEIDLNNHYKNAAGYGMLITGLGEYNSTAAISVDRADTTSDWTYGVWVKKFKTYGIYIDASTAQSPQYGLSISGMDSNHIRITPKDTANPSASVVLVQDSTGTTNQFTIAANGATRIGAGSNAITSVLYGHINSIAVGSIPANSTVDVTQSVSGVTLGTTNITVSFYGGGEPAGVVLTGWVSANGQITLRFANVTTSTITVSSINVIWTAVSTQ